MTDDTLNDANTKRILDKVAKLKAHAESAEAIGNEQEAQAFAALYTKLLLQHNLSLSDIEYATLDTADPIEKHHINWQQYDMKKTTSQPWLVRLADLVMKANNCRHVRFTGTNRFYIVGRGADAKVAEWMYVTLVKACERIAANETAKYRWAVYKRDKSTAAAQGFKKSFVQGFIVRLAERLEETTKTTVAESGETALVRVNTMNKKLDDHMAQLHKDDVRNTRSMMKSPNHKDGLARGRAAADGINLGQKPIANMGGTKGLLK